MHPIFAMKPLVVWRFWAYDVLHATVFSGLSTGTDVLREIFPRNDVDERARVIDCLTEEPIEPNEPLFVVGGMGYSRGSVERMRRSSSNDPFTRRAIDWESGDVDSKTPPRDYAFAEKTTSFPSAPGVRSPKGSSSTFTISKESESSRSSRTRRSAVRDTPRLC